MTEVLGYDVNSERYVLQDLFERRYEGIAPDGKVRSKLVATGTTPQCMGQLQAHGVELPQSMFGSA